jgi:hypothetical protein
MPYTAAAVYEEIFGPLDLVDAGATAERAVEAANRTQYGPDLFDSFLCLADFSVVIWINATSVERQFPV